MYLALCAGAHFADSEIGTNPKKGIVIKMIIEIFAAVAILALIGFIAAVLQEKAKADEAVRTEVLREKILECLPGKNCGACGYENCPSAALAIAKRIAPSDVCLAGGVGTAQAVGVIMGFDPTHAVRMRAQVMCSGGGVSSRKKYIYESGAQDCAAAARLGGGEKSCKYACVGLGSCVKSCPFDAIEIIGDVAVVQYQKCTGCGICVDSCPKHIISMIPYDCYHWVGCSSHEEARRSQYNCGAGCTGCGACERVCPQGAIRVRGKLASIDYSLCAGCGRCYDVCPTGVIWKSEIEGADGLVLRRGEIHSFNSVR